MVEAVGEAAVEAVGAAALKVEIAAAAAAAPASELRQATSATRRLGIKLRWSRGEDFFRSAR